MVIFEFGEIESVLQQHGQVRQAVVLAKADKQGDKQLVGYVVAEGAFDREAVMGFLKEKLPEHMIPSLWVEMEHLPLTFNGQINKKALPEADINILKSKYYEAPLKAQEAQLAVKLEPESKGLPQPALECRLRPDHIPLSYNQQSLWLIHQLEGSVQYHIPMILRFRGRLDEGALAAALQTIVNRHEVLRTVIAEVDGRGYQKVRDQNLWQLEVLDGPHLGESFNDGALQREITRLVQIPFDLGKDPMLRASLIRLATEDHVLVLTMHHIASDGWSSSILRKELVTIYEAYIKGRPLPLEPLPVQYIDYALWQRAYLQGEVLEEKIGYWKGKLQGLSPLQLPADFPRPPMRSTRGNLLRFTLAPSLMAQLQALGHSQNATLFMTLLAAFKVLLYRYSGQEDLCVGTPIAGRERQEVEDLMGYFVNTLALRTHLRGNMGFAELLQGVRATTLEAYEYQQVPFEKVVEALGQERDLSRNPVFQVMFVLQNIPGSRLQLSEAAISAEAYGHRTAKFDLTFEIKETTGGIKGAVEYCTDLYKQETIERMVGHYRQLLESIRANPLGQIGQLKLLPEAEEQLLLHTFNDTGVSLPKGKTIVDLFEEQVGKTPEAVAVVFEEKELTYRELDGKSNQLARYLRGRGVKEESLVPICIERSLEMVIGIMGILKAGAVYVPIDPAYPKERINYMLADTKATIVVGSRETGSKLQGTEGLLVLDAEQEVIDRQPIDRLPITIGPNQLAYVIYTSGSTGKPKGVMIEHHSVVNFLLSMSKEVEFTTTSNLISITSYSFDIFNLELYLPLINGGKVIVVSREDAMDGRTLLDMIRQYNVTVMQATPATWRMMLDGGWDEPLPLKVLCCGEALPGDLADKLYSLVGSFWNGYGPTETTIYSTTKKIEAGEKVLIGKPIDNTSIYIISKDNQQNPVGVAGELCIAGEGVGRGYLNRPELTEEKFIANPFVPKAGSRMYRTGDLARWLPDGNIEYLGRLDDQVKIRGYRIELGEIEGVLQQHGQVRQAVVLAKADKQGDKQLVGYVIAEGAFDREAVMGFLREKLPEHMIPFLWVEMEHFPLTLNGKIDRKALPEADTGILQSRQFEAPRTAREAQLAGIWQRLLGIEKIGIHDDFFVLGGHSLLAMRAIAAVRKEMELELSIRELFTFPTVAQLAVKLEPESKGLPQPALECRLRPDHIPLSYNQQSLWLIHQLEGSVQYHIPMILRFRGRLDEGALAAALQTIVNRHEVLRTVIAEVDGRGYQKVRDQDLWQLEVLDSHHLGETSKAETLQRAITRLIQVPFDLGRDHMLRASLIMLSTEDHVLVLTMHHIASDGWSSSLLRKELVSIYEAYSRGRPMPLAPLSVQYIDYALWQRAYLQGNFLEEKLGYWKGKLKDLSPLQLPTDFPRPSVQSTRGSILRFTLDPGLTAGLQALGHSQNATLFMTLLAAFKVLLYRYSGQEDLCVGTPTAGRERQEVEELMGYFVNTLALRTHLQGSMSFAELLQGVRATTLEAYENQQVPFEKVVEALGQERDLSRNPVFQVMFVLQNVPGSSLQFTEARLTAEAYKHRTATFDLTVELTETEGGIEGAVEYCTDLYTQETIERMVGHYRQLLVSIKADPLGQVSQLKLLPEAEEQLLIHTFNTTQVTLPKGKTIVDMFEKQLQNCPDAVAVVFEEKQLTYRELNGKANQLAHYLRSMGIKEESLVPICIERSLEMIIGIVGILKAGAAYVPIDPAYPKERINYVLEDTHADVVVTNRESKTSLPDNGEITVIDLDADWANIAKESMQNPLTRPASHHLAYVIYTSGSTGKPKGVMIEHRGLAASTQARQSHYRNHEAVLLIPSFAFDSSVAVIFGSLSTGGRLIICRSEFIKDPNHIKRLLRETKIILCVPSYYRILLEEELLEGSALSKVIVAGENLDEKLVKLHYDRTNNIPLYNEYGPTECTVWATVAKISLVEKVTIGKPINNTSIYIVGKERELNPIGIAGELCIAGEGLARGYLNRRELTEEKFVPNPFNGEKGARMYRTGDLARWLPDGNIEYLGRLDDQVKIRGYRIELGEIEAALNGIADIRESAVSVREDVPGDKRLVGYVVCGEPLLSLHEQERPALVRERLRKLLPEYMIPGDWVFLDRLPLTANNKIDRKRLPQPRPTGSSEEGFIAPGNETERELAEIWKNILHLERVSIHDNFFNLGGHSLSATRLISSIRKQLVVELGIKDLFTFPTIAGLSVHLQSKINAWVLPPIEKADPRPELLPLSYSQESLWFIDQLEGSIQYHMPTVLRLRGAVDEQALSHALRMVLERHEVLRTVLRNTDGKPWQKVMDPEGWHLSIVDGNELGHRPEELHHHIETLIKSPFDLAGDYMFRASLIRLNHQDHMLVLTMHHIASDGWSIPVLLKELKIFYLANLENKAPEVLPLPVQYADFALWQRNNLKGEFFDKKVNYWKGKLLGLVPLQLPTDHPRPEARSNRGALRTFTLDHKLRDQILLLGQQEGTTLFMTLLTAFKVLLYRYCNQEDICVGTASAGRQHQETEDLIGYFINPLPIRSSVENEALFSALLQEVKANSLESFDNQEVPFEKIVSAVSSYRDFSKNPLFQVMFVLQNLPETTAIELGQLIISQEATRQTTSKFDLTFILSETPGGIQGSVEYSTDLYRENTIDWLMKGYVQLLQAIALNPRQKIKDIDFLMEDRVQLFPQQDFDPISNFPEFQAVHTLIEQASHKFGDKTAVFFGEEKCSYTGLNEQANRLAHFLIQNGVVPGDIVGIIMDRSIDMIVAVLGSLKAGGAYLPIDTDYPDGRVEYMLKDSARIHITQKEYKNKFSSGSTEIIWEDFVRDKENYPKTNPLITTEPQDAAYIIYTSGSTGRPKGVIIEHHNLFNFLVTASRTPGITQDDRFLAVSSVSFDIAILEMLLPYVHGAQSFILDKYQRKDPQVILEVAEKESISVMFATPTHWNMILDSGWEKPFPNFNIISGGEALTNGLADRLLPLCKSLWNIYGPTETTVFSTIKEIKKSGELITIGKPVLNTHIYILDETLNAVRIGKEGEIFISGSGVARGYLNQAELTDEKFLKDPFHPAGDRRMYRTGDRGKYLPDGEIVILGRKDHQVKLRGYRIELGEIEHALARLDRVREGIVAVKEMGPGNLRLVAYLLLSGGEAGTTDRKGPEGLMDRDLRACRPTPGEVKDWKRQLAVFLPPFMVPTDFVVMENFPLTASGKTDRKMLPEPPLRPIDSSSDLFLPETPEEKLVANIWCEALGIPQVDITDNFFELGGHSLIAVQVMTHLEKESGIKLPLSILFKYPTVQKLALALQSKDTGAREWDSLVPLKPHGHKPPLYIVHGGGLNVLPFYTIAKNMDPGQPVYGLQAKGLDGMEEPLKSVEDIASHYISQIIKHNPKGPYSLAGYSLGGIIALEIAKQLKMSGKTVKELIMFDTYAFQPGPREKRNVKVIRQIEYSIDKRLFDLYLLKNHPRTLKRLKWESLDRRVSRLLIKLKIQKKKPENPIMKVIKNIESIQKEAGDKYILTYYDGPIHLLRAKIPTVYVHDPIYLGWRPFVKEINIWEMEGEHTTMFSPPNDVQFARVLQEILDSIKN